MKDHIASVQERLRQLIKDAIFNTFQRRGTDYSNDHPLFNPDFATNPQRIIRWKSFLKKSNLDTSIDLGDVLRQIDTHLYQIYASMRANKQKY